MNEVRKHRPLVILNVAYPLFPVTAGSAGGAEQIVYTLDKGLTKAGIHSIVIAAEGSRIAGELIATPNAPGEISEAIRKEAERIHLQVIEGALARYKVDLIHFHGLDFLSYRPRKNTTPQFATLHLPLAWYPENFLDKEGLEFNLVSESQRASDRAAQKLPVVANGIDLEYYCSNSHQRGDYLLWLGRICPEKGTDVALRVAHRMEMPLTVAGPVHPFSAHRKYFVEQVEPLLDAERQWIGAVQAEEKAKLLAHARCLLIPSLAAETSSLVAMEAIASGTPVIAFRSGALPEIVEHEVTGFVVESEEEMSGAVSRVSEISAKVCRAQAEIRFSAQRMVADYQLLYEQILSRRTTGVQ